MIRYIDDCSSVRTSQLAGFFEGWPDPPSCEAHLRMLRSSSNVALAISETDQVVGFATAISDGVLSAYIPFLEVLPSHRSQGVGQELVRRLLNQLRDIYSVNLHCDPDLEGFYQRLGMQPLGGMAVRNYDAQSGR